MEIFDVKLGHDFIPFIHLYTGQGLFEHYYWCTSRKHPAQQSQQLRQHGGFDARTGFQRFQASKGLEL